MRARTVKYCRLTLKNQQMLTHLDIEYKQYFDVDEKFVAKKVWIPCMEKSLEERILRRRLWKAKWSYKKLR